MRVAHRDLVIAPAGPDRDAVGEVAGGRRTVRDRGRRELGDVDLGVVRHVRVAGVGLRIVVADQDAGIGHGGGLVADHQHVAARAEVDVQRAADLVEVAGEEVDHVVQAEVGVGRDVDLLVAVVQREVGDGARALYVEDVV